MLCMLFNVYISTIRYVLLISSFCRWGKQGTEKPRNLLLVTHEPEKLGFQPCSLAIEPQLPISELCCLLTNGSSPWAVDSHYRRNDCGNTHIPQIYVYTQTHTPIHTRFKRLKWCITYKISSTVLIALLFREFSDLFTHTCTLLLVYLSYTPCIFPSLTLLMLY